MRLFELEMEDGNHVFDVEKICEMRTSDTDVQMWARPYFISITFYNHRTEFAFESKRERNGIYNKILSEMRELER